MAVLTGPSWDSPSFVQYEAVHPRPQVEATYEVSLPAIFCHQAAFHMLMVMRLTFLCADSISLKKEKHVIWKRPEIFWLCAVQRCAWVR